MGKNSNSGLGKALTNRLEKKKTVAMGDRAPIFYQETQENQQEKKKAKLKSMVDQNSLSEFLQIAQISEKDFHANRDIKFKEIREQIRNKKIIPNNAKRTFQVEEMVDQQLLHRLQLPRRPKWQNLSKDVLQKKQAQAYLAWRRALAQVQQKNFQVQITPYEKNIEVWKQLWRVVDRSDMVIQIVDGRDPLFFRSEDLVEYIKELSNNKKSLVLINKSDLVAQQKIIMWNQYFTKENIDHVFFSAKQVASTQQEEDLASETTEQSSKNQTIHKYLNSPNVLTVSEIVELMDMYSLEFGKEKIQIGMVGYPNVGKSSVINAMLGKKKVAVASMPGKTKHFQTLQLTEKVTLCDCPGLVFPRISSSYAEMVLNGLYSIDTLKSFTEPMQILAMRIKKKQITQAYSVHWKPEQSYDGEVILEKYAMMRGFFTGNGLPNKAISARNILKDYVTGVLKYAKHPPGYLKANKDKDKDKEKQHQQHTEQFKQQEENNKNEDEDEETQEHIEQSNIKKQDAEKEKLVDGQFFGNQGEIAALSYEDTVNLLTEDDLLDIIEGKQLPTIHITKQMRKTIKFALKRGEKTQQIIKKVFLGKKDKYKAFTNERYEK